METEFQGIDLDLWKRLVKKMQVENLIYPGDSATERDCQRVADLLDDLFSKNFKTVLGLRNDFYLLARVYCLETDIPREGPGEPYVEWDPNRDRFLFLEFTKYTRLCFGLTMKKIEEVETGVDSKTVVSFFEFLFKNFRVEGYLPIVRKFGSNNLMKPSFFNIKDGFDQVAEFLESDIPLKYRWLYDYSFGHSLLTRPISDEGLGDKELHKEVLHQTIGTPCLYIDVDENFSDLEEKISKYKIWPSIRVKTSPRGMHLFWVLRRPALPGFCYTVVDAQVKLAKLLGGDLARLDFGGGSRVPGMFNFCYVPPHFVSFETSDFEYDLEDFINLPYGFMNFKLDVLRGVYK